MKVDGLLINGQNAYDTFGVIMGDDFLNQLDAPAELKEFLSFESRTADGTEYLLRDANNAPYARVKARDLTLKFRIFASDSGTLAQRQASLQTRKNQLLSVLMGDLVAIAVPDLNSETYHLLYSGQSITYDLNPSRTTCLFGAKFIEPNPKNRYPYGTCPTAKATAAKEAATTSSVSLTSGQKIRIKFSDSNTANSPTLKVNSLAAKNIITASGSWSSAKNWVAGSWHVFTYNGTAWVID